MSRKWGSSRLLLCSQALGGVPCHQAARSIMLPDNRSRDRPADPRGVDGFQALQAGTVRPPEGKPAASEGEDGEVQGSRSSLVRMRDMDPPEVPLRQAPYNTPQDVASNSRSLVQVAEQAHPLVQRCPSPNPMREHRNNRTHEEAVVGGGATPHG